MKAHISIHPAILSWTRSHRHVHTDVEQGVCRVFVVKTFVIVEKWGRSCSPLTPALKGQRQVDICEFEASLISTGSSRPTRVM